MKYREKYSLWLEAERYLAYNKATMKFRERVEIKPSCDDCPMMARFEALHDSLDSEARELLEAAMSGKVNEMLKASLIEDGTPEDIADEIIKHHAPNIHNENVSAVSKLDERTEASASVAEKFLESCEGRMKMRAQRHGRQVTVTVCMSEMMDLTTSFGGGDLVTVKRERADKDS